VQHAAKRGRGDGMEWKEIRRQIKEETKTGKEEN